MAREFVTVEDAVATAGVVHVVSGGGKVVAYDAKDALPEHCKSDKKRALDKGLPWVEPKE